MRERIGGLAVGVALVASILASACAPAVPQQGQGQTVTGKVTQSGQQTNAPTIAPATTAPGAPATQTAAPGPEMENVKLTKTDGTVVEKLVEKPRYGGVAVLGRPTGPLYLDDVLGHVHYATLLHFTNEDLLTGDWAKGPSGTGEAGFYYITEPSPDNTTGMLAESWEIPDNDTLVFHIRQGVRFAINRQSEASRLVNGRELTADDVVFSLKRLWETPGAYHGTSYKGILESVTAPDKWTVIVKAKPGTTGNIYRYGGLMAKIVPREVVGKYGNLADWKNSSGTGAFMFADYVPQSSATFVKNPDYWMKDPIHPQNQLPYVDGVKVLFIPDLSTRLSAMRTGKIDHLGGYDVGITASDASSLTQYAPDIKYIEYPAADQPAVMMRSDTKPFTDRRVRQAMNMAVDRKKIDDALHGGRAITFMWPVMPIPEFSDMFIPLEQYPESSRQLFEYRPDQAKKLLAEAGYPDGFKTEIITLATNVELVSLLKGFWQQVGVDVDIQVKDPAVFRSISVNRTHTQMYMQNIDPLGPYAMTRLKKEATSNMSIINDPRVEEAYYAILAAWPNEAKRRELYKELAPYLLDQAWFVLLPAPALFNFWQPWLKGYNGELQVGLMNTNAFIKYTWLDLDLRQKKIGTR